MLTFLEVAVISFFSFNLATKDCATLKNGKYRLTQFTPSATSSNKITSRYHLIITDNDFVQYWNNGDSTKGKIEWIDDCSFKLVYVTEKVTEDNEFGKLFNGAFGAHFFELQGKKGRKIRFRTTYTGNLHITTSEGTIVKTK